MNKQIKVILTQDIKNVGKKWNEISISRGFYLNHPLLKSQTWIANQSNCRRMEKIREQEHKECLLKKARAEKLHQQINNLELSFILKKDSSDKAFGSVRAEDIWKELEKRNLLPEKKQLLDFQPLTLGDNLVQVKLGDNLIAQVKIKITTEK